MRLMSLGLEGPGFGICGLTTLRLRGLCVPALVL